MENKDHFIVRNGVYGAGAHLILDMYDASYLDNIEYMKESMVEAVYASGATLLHIHLHHFTPNYGISGVAVLAESHMSVHTWPEKGFAAFDIFMCGEAKPEVAADVLIARFKPVRPSLYEIMRGTNW